MASRSSVVIYSDFFTTNNSWHHYTLYECAFCKYATVDGMQAIIKHLAIHGMSKRVVYQNIGRVERISDFGIRNAELKNLEDADASTEEE